MTDLTEQEKQVIKKFRKEHCGQVFYSVRDKETGQLKRKEAVEVITKEPEKLETFLIQAIRDARGEREREIKEIMPKHREYTYDSSDHEQSAGAGYNQALFDWELQISRLGNPESLTNLKGEQS